MAARLTIWGLGPYGYIVAAEATLQMLDKLPAGGPDPLRIGPR